VEGVVRRRGGKGTGRERTRRQRDTKVRRGEEGRREEDGEPEERVGRESDELVAKRNGDKREWTMGKRKRTPTTE